MALTEWQKYIQKHACTGKSFKQLAIEYRKSKGMKGKGLSGGMPSGGKRKMSKSKSRGGAAKGALADLLKGLTANVSVK